MSIINFDDSLLDDFVSAETLKDACPSWWKPTAFDQSTSLTQEQNSAVFCKTESALSEFFHIMRQNPTAIRKVVTHNSDLGIDSYFASLRPPNVTKWFAANSLHEDPNIIPLPLGIANTYKEVSDPPTKINAQMPEIRAVETKGKRTKLLYVNHRVGTYPSERAPITKTFEDREKNGETWFTIGSGRKNDNEMDKTKPFPPNHENASNKKVIIDFLNEMVDHKFVLCPRGNGMDTHRLWEALYTRTVPIVRYEPAHRYFTDLPILFISNWNEITEDYLLKKYDEMSLKTWDYSKLKTSWWAQQINAS
jgi:hypothetical protein